MTTKDEALRLALEWIEAQPEPRMIGAAKVVQSLREALAQKDEQEPDCQDTHYCSACGEPQFSSPSGMTCVNGHGGADSILVEDLYVGVLDPDGEEVEWEGYERLPYNPTNAYRFSVKTTPSQYFSAAYFSAQKGGIRVKHKQLLDLILAPTP